MLSIFKNYPLLFASFSQVPEASMKLTGNPEIMKKISRNRNAYFLKNNIVPSKVVSAEIVHGNKTVIVKGNDGGKVIPDADGLITQSQDVYLAITSADCLPIFLFDPKKEIVGMIHAGWRSLANDILPNAVEKMKNIGGIPKNISVGIGPAICQKHYEVGPNVAKKFERCAEAIKNKNTKIFLDLKKVAELQFLALGIEKKNIEISPECTFELEKKYFSHRREKTADVRASIALIGMRNN